MPQFYIGRCKGLSVTERNDKHEGKVVGAGEIFLFIFLFYENGQRDMWPEKHQNDRKPFSAFFF